MSLLIPRQCCLRLSSRLTEVWPSLRQLFLLFLICSSIYINVNGDNPSSAGNGVAIENDILHFSYELERWLDTSIRPCQNFYSFVCSKSLNGSEAQQIAQNSREAQQQKFEEFLAMGNDEQLMDAELKLKQFYISCKEARSLEDLKGTLMYRSAGGWPAVDDAAVMIRKRRNTTWLGVLSAFHEAGFEYFFKARVEIKSNKRIVHLDPDTTIRYTLRKFEQLTGEVLDDYVVEVGRARLVALEIMNFERNRRECVKSESVAEIKELSYATFKSTLFTNALQAEWDAYFKRTLGKAPKATDTVLIHQMPKLMQYFEFLQNTTMTRLLNWIWIHYLTDKNSSECQSLVRHYFEPVYEHIVEHAVIDKVQIAQMYADINRAYNELLPKSTWIDEMSQEISKQFYGRVMHVTLNGDTQIDGDLSELTITKRNFYRNLEKMQRHLTQQSKDQQLTQTQDTTLSANEFMKIFLRVGELLQKQNLTTPLNYALVGERFAERMIASGSSSATPGAWRSMDSEREFALFKQCLGTQTGAGAAGANATATPTHYNPNDLLLRILAQHQALNALDSWQTKNAALWQRLDRLLLAGRLQLTLRKLYFIGAMLTSCRPAVGVEERQFVESYLRNSQAFTQTFGCRPHDAHYARAPCRVL